MDPNTALANARKALEEFNLPDDGTNDVTYRDIAATNLAEAFDALDKWLCKAGFLPHAWENANSPVEVDGHTFGFAGDDDLFVQIDGYDVVGFRFAEGNIHTYAVSGDNPGDEKVKFTRVWPPHPSRIDFTEEFSKLVAGLRITLPDDEEMGIPSFGVLTEQHRYVAIANTMNGKYSFFFAAGIVMLENHLDEANVGPADLVIVRDLATGKNYRGRTDLVQD